MTLLQIRDLKKNYGANQAVNGLNLEVAEGEIFGILGPNGAGKSTTMSIICGLLRPNAGSVMVGGFDLQRQAVRAKELIGVVPQEPALYPQLSAAANLKFWGMINGLSGRKLENAVEQVLEEVGLKERAKERVGKYSGGMKRRLNIAAGLLHNPKLLIMDEPTVGVDPQSRNHILETVKRLKDKGTTVLYTSHYVEEVEDLCERVAVMDRGKIISQGTVSELLTLAGEFQELDILLNRPEKITLAAFKSLPGVEQVAAMGQSLRIRTGNAEQLLALALETTFRQGLEVTEIKIKKPNLESLFLQLTGRALRD